MYPKIQAIFCLFLCLTLSFSFTYSQSITVNATPASQSVERGQTATFQMDVTPSGGFSQQVFGTVTSSNLPAGVTTNISPTALNSPYTGGFTLTVTVPGGTTLGTYSIVMEAANGPVFGRDTAALTIVAESCPWVCHQGLAASNFERDLAIDNNDEFWTAGVYGLRHYNGFFWTTYTTQNSAIPTNSIVDVKVHPATNEIWMGSNMGLIRFDGTFWTVYDTATSGIAGNYVFGVAIDSSGNVWCSTGNSFSIGTGIARFDGTNWTTYTAQNSGLTSDKAETVEVDRSGNIWAVTAEGSAPNLKVGLAKFDGSTWSVLVSGNSCMPNVASVNAITFDNNNHLWAVYGPQGNAHANSGLMKYDGNYWEFWNGKNHSNFNHILKDSNCTVLQQDNTSMLEGSTGWTVFAASDNTVWLGLFSETSGLGEGAIAILGQNWTLFNTNNSNLYGDAIGGFAEDSDGHIWATVDIDYYGWNSGHELCEFDCDSLPLSAYHPLNKQLALTIYPNPATEFVHVEDDLPGFSEGKLRLYDMQGRMLQEFSKTRKIDVSELASGMYFLELKSEMGIYFGRFVRQ